MKSVLFIRILATEKYDLITQLGRDLEFQHL